MAEYIDGEDAVADLEKILEVGGKVGAVVLTAVAVVSIFATTASAGESFVDNVLRDKIPEPAIGSVVYCELALCAEHSGIYIGNGEIIHLDGSGLIVRTDHKKFLERLDGYNPAMSIYTSCKGQTCFGSKDIADYALRKEGWRVDYSILNNNCHMFSSKCILNTEEVPLACRIIKGVKYHLWKKYDAGTWRVWDV